MSRFLIALLFFCPVLAKLGSYQKMASVQDHHYSDAQMMAFANSPTFIDANGNEEPPDAGESVAPEVEDEAPADFGGLGAFDVQSATGEAQQDE